MNKRRTILVFFFAFFITTCFSQTKKNGMAPKPLFDDPVYHGAADPVIIWDKKEKEWLMFYTNRRATLNDSTGVKWVHGTKIGIASSKDGGHWKYLDTANINYRPDEGYTFWAPDILEHNDLYHMYLTYVPGIFENWNHPRNIIHLTSKDLFNWKYEATLQLANDKVIDASIFQLSDDTWRLWYNNEKDGKSIYYADSKDLYHFTDKGKAIAARGEGPKIFAWRGINWMIIDAWKGFEVYQSNDLLNWNKQSTRLLEEGGTGKDDGVMGNHCDVLVNDDKAYLFYFTHPGRTKVDPAKHNTFNAKRSVIQVVELKYNKGELTCDRNQATYINIKPNKK